MATENLSLENVHKALKRRSISAKGAAHGLKLIMMSKKVFYQETNIRCGRSLETTQRFVIQTIIILVSNDACKEIKAL